MTVHTEQLKIWKSTFGKEWTDRNVVDPITRVSGFTKMVDGLKLTSILEVGCGAGHNLVTLSKIVESPCYGVEPNAYARKLALKHHLNVVNGTCFNLPFEDNSVDLAFTCGVLMHVSSQDLPKAITEIVRVAKKYVLIIEYHAYKETPIPYRGHDALLWKRNYNQLFKQLNLIQLRYGYWSKGSGFDGCHWWLLLKAGAKVCELSPMGQHHWIITGETMTCKYCNESKPVVEAHLNYNSRTDRRHFSGYKK